MATRPRTPGPAAHSTGDSRQTITADDEWGLVRGFGRNCLPTTPREPTWLHCRLGTFALFVGLAAFFVYLSHRPLWHTDLWGHLAYGRLIVAERNVPATEPLLPLCQGVPFVDFSWLSEVIGYLAERCRGVEALQFLYASAVITGVGLLAACTLRKTGSAAAAALAAALYVWVDWQQLAIMRPQLAGSACFLGVFLLATGRAWRETATRFRISALATALLFAAWANLHGSFLIGLVLVAAFILGRAIDLLRRTGRLRAVHEDRRVRRGLIVLTLAAVACLLNPYGWRIFPAAWELSSNANLQDLVEWQPLGWWMRQAGAALVVSLGLLGLYALTPRRIPATEILLLVGLGGAMLAASRMIVWWGPLAAYYASLHVSAVAQRPRRARGPLRSGGPSVGRIFPGLRAAWAAWSTRWVSAGVLVVVAVCALLLTPLCDGLFAQIIPTDRRHYFSDATPLDATDYMRAHPPHGQIFNPMEWGDYLLWAGPPGLEVFAASHAHLLPSPVWQDYVRVITLDDGWQKILEQYRINTVVVDDDQHAALADALRTDPQWSLAYEDDTALVFVRRTPAVPSPPKTNTGGRAASAVSSLDRIQLASARLIDGRPEEIVRPLTRVVGVLHNRPRSRVRRINQRASIAAGAAGDRAVQTARAATAIGLGVMRPVAMMGLIVAQAAVQAGAVGRPAFGARILGSAVDRTVRSRSGGHRALGSRGLGAHNAGIGRATGAGQPEHAEGQSQDNFSIHRLVFLWAGFAEP